MDISQEFEASDYKFEVQMTGNMIEFQILYLEDHFKAMDLLNVHIRTDNTATFTDYYNHQFLALVEDSLRHDYYLNQEVTRIDSNIVTANQAITTNTTNITSNALDITKVLAIYPN